MNGWLILVLTVIGGGWLLELLVETLNVRHAAPTVPAEFRDVFAADKYRQAQAYLRETTRFGLFTATAGMLALLALIATRGFDWLDLLARHWGRGEVTSGLVFAGGLGLAAYLFALPFAAYRTFAIEARYGFNRTTVRTFVLDRVKELALGAVLGGIMFAGVVWFFAWTPGAWLWAWLTIAAFQLLLVFLAPVAILPLFNRFTPLAAGELRTALLAYAERHGFQVRGIFTMDGSKRSTKANAYFTGFGRFRRIVLYDTLVAKHSAAELVSILAHEVGHCRARHVPKLIAWRLVAMGVMFYVFSLLVNNAGLVQAFGVTQPSVYASLIFIGLLFEPLSLTFAVAGNALARRFEYQADRFAAATTGGPAPLATALKRLTAENLGNLTPHPLKVFLEYDHPPVLQRLRALAANAAAPTPPADAAAPAPPADAAAPTPPG